MTAYDDTVKRPVPTPPEDWHKLNRTPQQTIKIKRMHRDAQIPKYQTDGAACFDLHAMKSVRIEPGHHDVFDIGLAFEVPAGHVMLVYSRSGHGFNYGMRLVNGTGVIDSDYRGQLRVGLANNGKIPVVIAKGDRIAQAMLVPIPRVQLVEVDELTDTARGAGGFGSTGA